MEEQERSRKEAAAADRWVVRAPWSVAVRAAPSASAEKVGEQGPGTVVSSENVLEVDSGNKWLKLEGKEHYMLCFENGVAGWILDKIGGLAREAAQWAVTERWTVAVRAAPSTSAEKVGKQGPGTVVSAEGVVVVDGNKWLKLDGKGHYMLCFENGDAGWVMHKIGGLAREVAQWAVKERWSVAVRAAPSTSAEEVGKQGPGTVVSAEGVLEVDSGDKWLKLQGKNHYMLCFQNGDAGWILDKVNV